MPYSKTKRFHLLSLLGCSNQAWDCLASTPQGPGLYHLFHIIPFPVTQPSLDLLFPDPASLQMNNSSPIAFSSLVLLLLYQYLNLGPEGVVNSFLSHLRVAWYFCCALLSLQDTTFKWLSTHPL